MQPKHQNLKRKKKSKAIASKMQLKNPRDPSERDKSTKKGKKNVNFKPLLRTGLSLFGESVYPFI